MRAVELVFAIGWGTFWLYWLVAAFFIKRLHVSWSRKPVSGRRLSSW